jgi:hypothetical protein
MHISLRHVDDLQVACVGRDMYALVDGRLRRLVITDLGRTRPTVFGSEVLERNSLEAPF